MSSTKINIEKAFGFAFALCLAGAIDHAVDEESRSERWRTRVQNLCSEDLTPAELEDAFVAALKLNATHVYPERKSDEDVAREKALERKVIGGYMRGVRIAESAKKLGITRRKANHILEDYRVGTGFDNVRRMVADYWVNHTSDSPPEYRFSPGMQGIVDGLTFGLSNQEIADATGLSVSLVRKRVGKICERAQGFGARAGVSGFLAWYMGGVKA